MKLRKWRTGSIALSLLLALASGCLTGCDARRTQLQSQIETLTNQSSSISQQISNQQSSLVALQQRLSSERTALDDYNASVQNYMLQHKMAVAAIVAGVAGTVPWLEGDGKYSQDAKELGLALTVVAIFWASQNMAEVSEVLGNLTEADEHRKSAQAEIDQTSEAIQQQQVNLQSLRNQLNQLAQQIDSVNGELSRL